MQSPDRKLEIHNGPCDSRTRRMGFVPELSGSSLVPNRWTVVVEEGWNGI